MPKFVETVVTGVPQIDAKLRSLTSRVQKKLVRQAEREVCKLIKRVIVRNAPHGSTGAMSKSVVVRAGKRQANRITTWVGYARGMQKGDKWYETFNEFGAKRINYKPEHSVKRSFDVVYNAASMQLRQLLIEGIDREAAR